MRRILVFINFFFVFLFLAKISYAQIVINEFLPRPDTSSNEWVEFYNSGNADADLSGYYFDDDLDFNTDVGNSSKIILEGLMPSFSTCYLTLNTYLNNDGDNPTLFTSSGSAIDSYDYKSSQIGKTFSRVPDGGEWVSEQTPTKSSIDCKQLVPNPTPTATTTINTVSAKPKSTYKINVAKGEDGQTLSNAEIYVNGDYSHHYAPEEFDFCDSGCDHGYGVYKFSVKKSGYETWEVEDSIGPGESYEADPFLKKLSVTAPPTTSTPKPSPSPTTSSTPKPTTPPDPFITIINDESASSAGDILGISENLSPTPFAQKGDDKNLQTILSWGLIILGIGVLSASGYYFYRNLKGGQKHEKN